MNRRGFLKGIIATASAPAFIRSDSIMGLYIPEPDFVILEDYQRLTISICRTFYPSLILKDIAGIQPLVVPEGTNFNISTGE